MPNSKSDISTKDRKRCFVNDEGGEGQRFEREARKATLHMANRERAFVAASRRPDRSLEARYHSALMASEVHKKRTGKPFCITYRIVKDEEMYEEEEDEGLPKSWLPSSDGYRGRTWSQTDAYVAALIARKSGMRNFYEHSHILSTMPTPKNAAWTEETPFIPTYNNRLIYAEYKPTVFDHASDDFSDSPELGAEAAANLAGEVGTDLDSCFAESAAFSDIISHIYMSSSSSSISDTSSCGANYVLEPSRYDPEPTRAPSHIRLQDCLLDADSEGFAGLVRIGLRL